MNDQRAFLSLIPQGSKKQAYLFFLLIAALYFFNFYGNDIWTPNESFYAEAVREMFESNDFLNINYNYSPRYNKPPLTYWSIAFSCRIFGINEFAIRLPIVLMALGSIWLTYLLGRFLYGEKGGFYAMLMMAVSLQLMAVKQYASPETPLTFFFTLTMYWFIKGYRNHNFKYLLLAYLALGLTALTKGFPYIIVIGGIIGLFLIIESNFKLKPLFQKVKDLKLHIGIPLVLIIGLSWVIFMYLKDGDSFWLVYKRETFDRALSKSTRGPRPFFYLGVIVWSIAPYSLSFYYALINRIRGWKSIREMSFSLSWFLIMLVIFTIAKGKIPTYFIQAHPALILITIPLILEYSPKQKVWGSLWKTTFLLPAFLICIGSGYLISELELSLGFYIIPLLVLAFWIYSVKNHQTDAYKVAPFFAMFGFLIVFTSYLPKLEDYRPYDKIGEIVRSEDISSDTPLLLNGWLIQNLPYYTERKTIRDISIDQINDNKGTTIAIIRDENLTKLNSSFEILWSGLIYDFPSESQFFKFVVAVNNARKGDLDKFAKFHLIYRP